MMTLLYPTTVFNTGRSSINVELISNDCFTQPLICLGESLKYVPLLSTERRCKYCSNLHGDKDEECDGCGAPL